MVLDKVKKTTEFMLKPEKSHACKYDMSISINNISISTN